MKSLLVFAFILFSFSFSSITNACPELQGKYLNCHSEIKPMKGYYTVDQHQESNFSVYQVQYIDDETGEARGELIKTDGQKASRKERLPTIGVNVRVDAVSKCDGEKVVSDSDVYFMGMKAGQFISTIYREGKYLKSNLDGSYLGKTIAKRIVCEIQ